MQSGSILSRREFLKAATVTTAALAFPGTASAAPAPAKAKSCIFLMLTGGPSQLDTWDQKPNAPSEIRGPFSPIPTTVPGMHLSELFPKMAGIADKFSLIRTMYHEHAPIHENGFQLLNTGRRFGDGPAWPSVGSVMSYLQSRENSLCFVSRTGIDTGVRMDHGQTCGWLNADRCAPYCFGTRDYAFVDSDSILSSFEVNCKVAVAFNSESDITFTTVNMFSSVFDTCTWDCHADGGSLNSTLADYRKVIAPIFDHTFADIVTSLDSRGLLDSTLVVAVGEFGRTPKLNCHGGRDHWANCWTAIVAGGGTQGGRIIGESDATASEPKDRPVHCSELVATIYHAMGISPHTTIPGPDGSPVRVVEANPVLELF
jgi:Protein of unknown function (DUF1501)/TAT (twin-arginine translocation) pathway signal sequence